MLKKTKDEINKMIQIMITERISEHLRESNHPKDPTYKICETCGCLIDSERAVEGESIIKYENSYRKEIYTPYYCQIHAPGKLAKVTEKDIIEIHRRYQVELTTLRNKYVKLEDKYKKLIMAVPYECAGETRFERALRYIKQYQILVDKEITPVTEIQKEKE